MAKAGSCSSDSTPSLGTSICQGCSTKKTKKNYLRVILLNIINCSLAGTCHYCEYCRHLWVLTDRQTGTQSQKIDAQHSWEMILHYARIYSIHDIREKGFDKWIHLSFLLPKCFHSSNSPYTPKQCPSMTLAVGGTTRDSSWLSTQVPFAFRSEGKRCGESISCGLSHGCGCLGGWLFCGSNGYPTS